MRTRQIITATLVFGTALALLAGCSTPIKEPAKAGNSKPSSSATPSSSKGSGSGTSNGGATPSATASAPGTKVGVNEWVSYDYTNTDKGTAVIAAKLVSVDAATQAQTDFLVSKIDQLKGYKIWLVHLKETKVSGAAVLFNSDYTNFYPATAAGKKAQNVSLIGWDECKTNSFPTGFDTVGTELDQCIVGASVSGGDPVVGAMYSSYDNKALSYYDGKPLLLLK